MQTKVNKTNFTAGLNQKIIQLDKRYFDEVAPTKMIKPEPIKPTVISSDEYFQQQAKRYQFIYWCDTPIIVFMLNWNIWSHSAAAKSS